MIDPMRTDFTVLSFDVTVTNIEIALADGTTPRGNEVVEGTEISAVVHVRNLGTKSGTVTVSLVEDMGQSRTWLTHGEMELSLSPGQSLETIPLLFETHGAGSQNLYVNISGMDLWIENSMLPHCYSINANATCDLNVESDMPRVISQEDAESGLSGMTAIVSILALLLLGAGIAIVVLLRRTILMKVYSMTTMMSGKMSQMSMSKRLHLYCLQWRHLVQIWMQQQRPWIQCQYKLK